MAYWKRFLFDEEGAELIQFALVIAIVAVLAIAIQGVVSSAEGKVNDAKNLSAAIPNRLTRKSSMHLIIPASIP